MYKLTLSLFLIVSRDVDVNLTHDFSFFPKKRE